MEFRRVLFRSPDQGADRPDQLIDTRSGIGIRLNAIDDALDVAAAQSEHAATAASNLRDTDYADAIGKLQLQMTTLQAAQQVYTKVQGLDRKSTRLNSSH